MAKMAKWRRHPIEFKRQVVERMKTCENVTDLARELSLQRKLLYTWKYQLEGRPERRHANLGKTSEERKEDQLRRENAELKKKLGEKAVEIDFFRDALRSIEAARQQSRNSGVPASTESSGRGRRGKAR